MDALKSISSNVPEWLKKLDHLSAQIEQRQLDLAAFADSASVRAPSIRNRGSTESLRPKDENAEEPVADMPAPTPASAPAAVTTAPFPRPDPVAAPENQSGDAIPTTAAQRQPRSRPTVKRKQKSASIASINVEGKPVAVSRTRNMIIVYYDSFVQSFFEELVKFVSVSRNYMRKAKMEAKVAQIKRMAEEEFDRDGGDKAGSVPFRLPPSRRYGPRGGGAGASTLFTQFADIYTQLDDHLEFVQTTSEKAAHQFLRDGDCDTEINNIQARLKTALEVAEKEMERLLKEHPEAASSAEAANGPRTHRPPTMRHNKPKKSSEQLVAGNGSPTPSGQASPKRVLGGGSIIEAADDDDDEGIEADWQPPKIEFRSTRNMGPRVSRQT